MVGRLGSPIDVFLAGIPLIYCAFLFEDNPISDISFLFSSKNPNNADFFFYLISDFGQETHPSKTRGGNELYSSYTSGKYILSALTRVYNH